MDINRQPAFVTAVVPLGKVRRDLGVISETGQFASPPNADQWTYKYARKLLSLESRAKQASVLLAAGVQRNIRAACVFARVGPIGIAVTDQEEAWRMLCFLCGQGS